MKRQQPLDFLGARPAAQLLWNQVPEADRKRAAALLARLIVATAKHRLTAKESRDEQADG